MSTEIAELRLHEVEDVIAFASELGCQVTAGQINHAMSLLVRLDAQIIGAALCTQSPDDEHGWLLHICLKESGSRDLAQHLTDKAMMKLHAGKLSKFTIMLHGNIEERTFWHDSNWLIRFDVDSTPNAAEKKGNGAAA